jgi:6-phosphogluconolactonase
MRIIRHASVEELARLLAAEISDVLACVTNPFLLLPGGTSPQLLMKELFRQPVDWSEIAVAPGDERCVPFDSEESNVGQIVKIMGNLPKLIPLWQEKTGICAFPPFAPTVAVIGMGTDGHFASIFPGMPWDDQVQKAYFVEAPKPPPSRVTLPIKIFLQAQRLVLLVCGSEKIRLIEEIKSGAYGNLPVARLMAARDDLEIHMAP